MSFDISVVIDKDVLDAIVVREIPSKLLLVWLQENDTKAVIDPQSWDAFIREWDAQLPAGETKEVFFRWIRGVIRPYRKDGVLEVPGESPHETIKNMINRDYDSVDYLIVGNPTQYAHLGIKIAEDKIMTLGKFFTRMEIECPDMLRSLRRREELEP